MVFGDASENLGRIRARVAQSLVRADHKQICRCRYNVSVRSSILLITELNKRETIAIVSPSR